MSSWQPASGNGGGLRRVLPCEGRATAYAAVERMPGLDEFSYVAMAACDAGCGTLICKAKACSAAEAQVIADALGKYVRHLATRKARKGARREMRRASRAQEEERSTFNAEGGVE